MRMIYRDDDGQLKNEAVHQIAYAPIEGLRDDAPIGHISIAEMTMLRDLIVAPYMLDMVSDAKGHNERWGGILAGLQGDLAGLLLDLLTQDLTDLRSELRRRKIKTWEEDQDEIALYIGYSCRGYTNKFGMTKEAARSQIKIVLGQYVGAIVGQLRTIKHK